MLLVVIGDLVQCLRRRGQRRGGQPRAPSPVEFLRDENLLDGAEVGPPGAALVKRWAFLNGPAALPAGTQVLFESGDRALLPTEGAWPVTACPVAPGQRFTVEVPLRVPESLTLAATRQRGGRRDRRGGGESSARAVFRLADSAGQTFGARFWVQLQVSAGTPEQDQDPAGSAETNQSGPPETNQSGPLVGPPPTEGTAEPRSLVAGEPRALASFVTSTSLAPLKTLPPAAHLRHPPLIARLLNA
jgi:hypothetical protein